MLFKKSPEDLKTALGQCFWIGINGTNVDDEATQEIFTEFQPGGVILFQRNVESIEQVRKLNLELQKTSKIPLFLAVDQEGGVVERLHLLIGTIPPAMAVSAAGSKRLAGRLYESHARILRSLGFNVNFVPVLDLALAGSDNGLGTRCFSNDPRNVTRFAQELIAAHERAGVLVCGKHFPGLGDTDRDSHLDLPTVLRPWKRMLKEDLFPYRKLLNRLPFIMVNHALYPEMNTKLPASLSAEMIRFLLTKLNYSGLSISDDLIMGAVSNLYNLPEAAEHALLAGNHHFLICRPDGVLTTYRKLLKRAGYDQKLMQSIFRSSSRILAFKFRSLPRVEPHWNLKTELQKLKRLTERISESAMTHLCGGAIGRLPDSCTIYLPRTKWIIGNGNALSDYFVSRGCEVSTIYFPIDLDPDSARTIAMESKTDWNMIVLANTRQYPGQMSLLRELAKREKKLAIVSGAYPQDAIPEGVEIAVASYWTAPPALRAAGMALVGERRARGKLPFK